ncbi:hlh transcription factor [Diplodia corticola]|uniref:Hlh transcription factor n=1 Tax=Diplodia corticola TaxID=236234 RepID=A0A1J9SAA4_9PEZI|nr:hlh transcription factor [Diplodia corticola]OJD36501.1 hlh transcription factor [Diplodia corticola]
MHQSQWSQSLDNMAMPHDFEDLLDFGDIDLDIPFYDHGEAQPSDHQLSALADSLDSQHLPPSGAIQPQNQDDGSSTQQQQSLQSPSTVPDTSSLFDFSFESAYSHSHHQSQQQNFSAPHDHSMQPRAFVPPTPNSVEMHGDATRYMHHLDPQTRAILDQRYSLRKEDVFTPLVSPAVTPHDSSFQVQPEFTVPGAYFSPLTSPALDAQNSRGGHQAYFSQSHTAENSLTTSPIDLDVDMLGEQTQQHELNRKLKNKRSAASTRSSGSTARIRQSPIVKPQSHGHRKKGTLSSIIPPKEVSDLLEQVHQSGPSSRPVPGGMGLLPSRDGSEAESISPEPLSEALMRPPPRPGSVTASPSIRAANSGEQPQPTIEGQQMCPATPASLMRLQPSPQNRSQPNSQSGTPSFIPQGSTQPINDDFALPEPAASTADPSRPGISRVDTTIHDDQSTPRMPARKTPKLGPLSTPSGSVLPSATVSPSIAGMASPNITGTKKPEMKPAGRGGKKRGSVGSALVSPALRPKISPSIKPLLPEGATTSDDTHALLLASKSNYQHILEGTHVPGVSYPEALSTNLTSKRTSHKIAEQGRRNRINIALQELQSLIPSPTIKPKDSGACAPVASNASPEESAQKKEERQSNSKASTVENAIEYIRLLQRKDEERDRKMMDQRREIEELRKRLESGQINSEKTGAIRSSEETVQKTKELEDEASKVAVASTMEVGGVTQGGEGKPVEQEAGK